MEQDKIKEFYENVVKPNGYFANEQEFRSVVSDPNMSKEFFDNALKPEGIFNDYAEFESVVKDSGVKKKSAQDLRPPLQQPIEPSATPTTENEEFGVVPATPTPQGYELKPVEVVEEKPNEYEKMRGAYLYGLKNYTENDEDYDILRSNVSPARKIELLEKRRSEQLPIETQDFFQEAAGAIGGTIKGMGKTMLAGFAAAPLSPISSVIASTGVAMGDGFRQGFASAYKEAYNDAIQQGLTPEQAIEKAENVAQMGGYGGIAEGAVGALPLTKPLTKLAKPASKLFQKGLEIAVDASVDASVAAGAQMGTNIAAQKEGLKRELTSGVKEAAIGEFAFGAGMNLSMPAFKYISKMTISSLATDKVAAKDRKEAITIAATQPIEVTNKALEESVKQGEITEQRANEIAEEVVSRQKALNAMPADMDLDEKNELADKVQERQRLEKEKETANEMVKPFIELKINELDKSVAIPLPPKYIDTAGQNTSELKDGQLYITHKGDVRMWDANLKQFLEPRSSFEVKAGTEVELEPTVTEIKEKEPKKTAATETGTKVVDDKIVEVEEGSNTLSEAEQTPKALSNIEESEKRSEIKNEGKADAPTKENVQERLNINNPFYKKVEDALVKLGLIEKYNPETKTGDVIGGSAQKTSDGGISAGKMLFNKDGSISYFDGDVEVSFDKNGNVISENTKEASEKNKKIEIEGKKESIANLEKTRDSENFKYKEVTETDRLGNRKKVRRLKTAQELKESTDKINSAIDKAKSELATLEGKKAEPTFEQKVEATAKALEGVRFNANFNLPLEQSKNARQVAEAYHKAKTDGSNPELVKAVEDLLGKKPSTKAENKPTTSKEQTEPATKAVEGVSSNSNEGVNPALKDVESTAKALGEIDARQQEAERSGQKPERAKPKPKVELTPLELAKQKLQQAKEKAKAVRDSKSNLSAVSDPFGDAKKQAEADREVFDAYVDLAKEYIKQGVKDIEQFAIEIGEDVTDTLRGAWDVAKGGVKKTVATKRAYEGTFRAEVRSEIEKYGLTREIESQVEAEKKARNFIDAVGENTAFEAVKNNDVVGGEAAAVLGDILRRNEAKIPLLKSEDDVKALNEFQGRVIEELGKKALEGGRFNAMLDRIYQTTDLGFNAEKRISDYVKEFGSIPKEVEQKFRDLEAQVKEVNAKLAEAERKAKEAEEKQAIDNIKESVSNEVKKSKSPAKIYGRTRIAKGLDDLADALGARKSVVSNSDAKVTSALAEIGRGLIEEGIATTRNVSEKIREYLQRNFAGKINFDKYESDVLLEITGATTNDGIKIPHSMIRQFVKDGIDNIDDLTTAVHEVLVKADPNITERQVRDAITGYGKVVMPTKDEIDISIRKMKRIGRVISALEDIANKKRPLRSGKQRDLLDAEERALNKELREAMKDLPMDEDTKANQLKTRLDAAKKRLENQIEDLEREIEKGEANKRSTKPLIEDEELTLLKERRDELKKERDAIIKDEEFNEKKRLETAKKRTQQSIAELQRKLQEGDFSKKQTKPIIADDELTKLKAEKLRIKEEYDKEFYKAQLNNRSKFEKLKDRLWEVWNIPRVLMATGEWSFVGIQGLKQSIAHPTYAVKAFKNALSVMKSDESAEKFIREIKSQEWYPIMKESKLALTEPNAELTAREELFYSGWTNAIWNLAGSVILQPAKFKSIESYKNALAAWDNINPIKATERAAVGYLDTLRVLRFLDGMKMLEMQGKDFQNNKQDYKDVADAINTMTGRASLGKAEMIAPQLSKVFFSPRNWASGIKTATPYALYYFGKMTPTARKMALSDLSKMVGLTTAMVGMAAAYLNNDDDDETSVELDPRSTDFMKIKLGDTRIDPWGGMQQQIVLSARIMADAIMKGFALAGEKPPIEGAIKKDKKILPLGVTYKTKSATDLIIQQATNKLNPAATLVYNFLQSKTDKQGKIKNQYGQDYTLNKEFSDKFYPIFWGTAYELLKEDPSALNGLLTFYAFFGGGVMVYEEKQKNKK